MRFFIYTEFCKINVLADYEIFQEYSSGFVEYYASVLVNTFSKQRAEW